jgi:hypothetical protein
MRRRMKNAVGSLVKVLMVGSITIMAERSVGADEIRACRLVPVGVTVLSRLEDAPTSLSRELTRRVGEVVPVGAPFDSTDVIRTRKNRRLIFIWNRGTRWVVATEHGGFGYNDPVFAFEIDESDLDKIRLVQEEKAFPDTVCSTASSLLVIGYQPNVTGTSMKAGTK